jgi:coenzyme F420-0:L-glutamate ligase / coenzyme F420-1:gamma-L-glutamate ligase
LEQPRKALIAAEPLPGLPEIEADADLGGLIADAARRAGVTVAPGDTLVVAQKAISKAEGRVRRLSDVEPGARARQLAETLAKDPRVVQLVLDESREVMRAERGVIIVRTHQGLVCANAGIDQSNLPDEDTACLLPEDPDASARRLRAALGEQLGVRPAVIVSDSFGRAWRLGQLDVAIGCAGIAAIEDLRGMRDAHGRELTATVNGVADAIAAAASLVRDKAGADAVVVVRGLEGYVSEEDGPGAAALRRPEQEDLFK